MINALNWFLIHLGDTARWLWDDVKEFFGTVFHALDVVLNPVLSPLLSFLNPICTKLGDAVFAALSPFAPWFGITLLSALLGVVMLIAFRHTSNQAAIARAKDDIKANLLAMKLFKDELHVTFRAQWRILGAILRLQRYILFPVLIMALPMMLCIAQMAAHYQWRPIRPGEQILLKLHVDRGSLHQVSAKLTAPAGVEVEVGPIVGKDDLVWRLRGTQGGRHRLSLKVSDAKSSADLDKELVVGLSPSRVSVLRPGREWVDQLLNPVEPIVPPGAPSRSIALSYPSDIQSWIYGPDYWVIYFFVVSMVAALLLAPVFRVRF